MNSEWPDLVSPGWEDSRTTLHLWTQIIGKTRLALAPMMNHWWHVPLYVTPRGLTTSPIPHDQRAFEVELDLLASRLEVRASDGACEQLPLAGGTLAEFHRGFFAALGRLGLEVSIRPLAVEIPETVYLDRDTTQRPYDPEWARRFAAALVSADRALKAFRGDFLGKASPVHFFWGGFDLATSRYSGRRAPRHPGGVPHIADRVMHEAYSHEVSSAGFWPGGPGVPEPVFYAYAYPEPRGYSGARVAPAAARWDLNYREFLLPYEAVRTAAHPDRVLRSFLERTYAAAADLAGWEREKLERPRVSRSPRVSREPPRA